MTRSDLESIIWEIIDVALPGDTYEATEIAGVDVVEWIAAHPAEIRDFLRDNS